MPWKNQFEPLSATISPYVFIAVSTTRASGPYRETSNDAFSRNRAPMGGRVGSVAAPAWWRAGHR